MEYSKTEGEFTCTLLKELPEDWSGSKIFKQGKQYTYDIIGGTSLIQQKLQTPRYIIYLDKDLQKLLKHSFNYKIFTWLAFQDFFVDVNDNRKKKINKILNEK